MAIILQTSYKGGVNEEDFLAALAKDEVRVAKNAIITRQGSLSKREGTSEFGTDAASNAIFAVKGFRDQDNNYWRLKIRNTALVEYNAGAWSTNVKTGLTAGNFMRISNFYASDDATTATGTAESGTDYSLTDSGASWTVNAYKDFIVVITAGTGSGQYKTILQNTATVLTVDGRWSIVPDATSVFEIRAKVRALICTNGVDTTFKVIHNNLNGLTTVDLTHLPKFTDALVVNNRLFGILGTRIYFSDLGNGEAIGTFSSIDTGEELAAIGQVGDYLAVYSSTKTGVLIGRNPDDFAFIWRDRAHGCIAPQTVSHWNGLSFALAEDGIYAFDGVRLTLMSRRISPSISGLNETLKDQASGFVFGDKYYFMHAENSTSTYKDKIWVMDLIWSRFTSDTKAGPANGAWTSFTGLKPNVMGTYEDSNGFLRLYYGESNSSKVIWLYDGSFSDSGAAIQFRVDTREFDLNSLGRDKKPGWMYYEGDVESVPSTLQIYRNLDSAGFELIGSVNHIQTGGLWDAAVFDIAVWGGPERIIQRLRPGGRGRTIAFQFYNNTVDEPVEMFKYECDLAVHSYH